MNFGNPFNPEVYWQFVGSIKGMSAACNQFKTPVTGGNVSFYNQSSFEGPVFPTPTIGMLGILEDKDGRMTLNFKNDGDYIYLIGQSQNDISSSEYLYSYHNFKNSSTPYFDLSEEFKIQNAVKTLIHSKLIQSAHDISEGGLFINLVESAILNNFGFEIFTDKNIRKDAFLFGEAQGRIVISVKKELESEVISSLKLMDVKFSKLGFVTGSDFKIDDETFLTVSDAKYLYENALAEYLA